MSTSHGTPPCWSELATSKGNLGPAVKFYSGIFGWKVEGSRMPGGAYIAAAQDPQGAWFAIVGASK